MKEKILELLNSSVPDDKILGLIIMETQNLREEIFVKGSPWTWYDSEYRTDTMTIGKYAIIRENVFFFPDGNSFIGHVKPEILTTKVFLEDIHKYSCYYSDDSLIF